MTINEWPKLCEGSDRWKTSDGKLHILFSMAINWQKHLDDVEWYQAAADEEFEQ